MVNLINAGNVGKFNELLKERKTPIGPMSPSVVAWWDWRDISNGTVASWISRNLQPQDANQTTTGFQPIRSSDGVLFDGSDDRLTLTRVRASLSFSSNMPSASGGASGEGFTSTGLFGRSDGSRIIGNVGIPREGSQDIPAPSIVFIDNKNQKLGEILLAPMYGTTAQPQGVVYDETDGTIWFADPNNNKVRHFSFDSSFVGTAITSDELTLSYPPSGLARWPSTDSLLVGAADSATLIEQISCVDGSVISSRNVTVSNRDGFWFDDEYDVLAITAGANGSEGVVYYYSWDQQNTVGSRILTGADAIEGHFLTKTLPWTTETVNDAYYHLQPSAKNALLIHRTAPAYTTKIILCWVGRGVTVTSSSTKGLISIQDPVVGQGLALVTFSPTEARVIANTTPTGTTAQISGSATGLTLTNETRLIAEVDTVANTMKIWADGILKSTTDASILAPLLATGGQIDIGRIPSGTRFSNNYTKIAGVIAGDVDIAALDIYLSQAQSSNI